MTKVGVEGFYMILKLVVTAHLSSQFFNYISDVEKQVQLHGSSWIYVLVVKVTTGRSWRITTFWNYSIIVRMVITSWHSHLQSSRIHQWWNYVSVCRQKLSDVVFTSLWYGLLYLWQLFQHKYCIRNVFNNLII